MDCYPDLPTGALAPGIRSHRYRLRHVSDLSMTESRLAIFVDQQGTHALAEITVQRTLYRQTPLHAEYLRQ